MESKYKRTRLWVDPPFQCRLLIRMCCYLFLFTVFVMHLSFAFQAMIELASGVGGKGIGELYLDFLEQQKFFLFSLALVTPVFLYDLLKFSHRIAGPLFRCRRIMDEMAAGQHVRPFIPRKHDLMREFFHSLSLLTIEWNKRMDKEQEAKQQNPAEVPHTNGFATPEKEKQPAHV
jgi:hypothetical protein